MADQPKGIGSKLLGLFVETPGGEKTDEAAGEGGAEKSAAELVAELAGQSGAAAKGAAPPEAALPPMNLRADKMTAASAGDKLDFNAIFKDGGVDPAELDQVKKAEDLLKGLPEATPHEIKKQIVEASLKAFGIEVVKIIQAASNQLRALDIYVKANTDLTLKAIGEAEAQIKQLNDKIASLRAEVDRRNSTLATRSSAAVTRKAEVQRVLDFFGGAPKP
jgi:hypothetical protein